MTLGQHTFGPVEEQVVNPTANDDSSAGFDVGTVWINTATDDVFLAADVSVGAAVWVGPIAGGGHNAVTLGAGDPALSLVGQELTLADVLTLAEHLAIGDAAPHHTIVSLAADAEALLGLTGQQLTLDPQDANLIFAGPAAGGAVDPTFRSLVDADIPTGFTRDAEHGDFDPLNHSALAALAGRAGGQELIGGSALTDTIRLRATSAEANGWMDIEDNRQVFGSAIAAIDFLSTSIDLRDVIGRRFLGFDVSGMQPVPDDYDLGLLIGASDDSFSGAANIIRAKMAHSSSLELDPLAGAAPVNLTFSGMDTIIYPTFFADPRIIYDITQSVLANYSMILARPYWRHSGNVGHAGFISGFRAEPRFEIDAPSGSFTVSRMLGFWSEPKILQEAVPTGGVQTFSEITAYTTWRGIAFGDNPLRDGVITNLRHYHAMNPDDDTLGQELAHADASIANQIGFDCNDMTQGTSRVAFRSLMSTGIGKWNMRMGTAQSYHEGQMLLGAASAPLVSATLELRTTVGALLLPRMMTTQRDVLTAVNGMMIYNSTTDQFQGYRAGAWADL